MIVKAFTEEYPNGIYIEMPDADITEEDMDG